MRYILQITRPLVDDEVLRVEFSDKKKCAVFLAGLILLEAQLVENFNVISRESTEDEMKVVSSTGTYHAFPKGTH